MSPTRKQVVVAAHCFPSEDRATILEVLDQYGIETHERERERVQMAILRLSEGSVDHLLSYTQHAKMDSSLGANPQWPAAMDTFI